MLPATETERKAPLLEKQKSSLDGTIQVVQKWLSPKWVDAILAGFFLTAASLVLHFVDLLTAKISIPIFNGAMLTTAIIFFGGPAPPPPKGFAICTVGSWALGFAIRFLMLESVSATCVGAGLLLVFFKRANTMFPPTLGVAVFLVSDQTGVMSSPLQALKWLLTPWLAGSAFLYGAAHLASIARKNARVALSKAKFKADFAELSDEKLKEAFYRFDTSGDGFLQADELKLAWQVVTGEEMTEAEAQEMIQSVDTDGNNEIDPDEFIALVREQAG